MRPAECVWPDCPARAAVDVLVAVPGDPCRLALRVGGYCAGHAVVVAAEVLARLDTEVWYAPLRPHRADRLIRLT